MPEIFTKNQKNKTLLNSNKRVIGKKIDLKQDHPTISRSINNQSNENMPYLRRYNMERIQLQQLYRKLRKGLFYLCSGNMVLSEKFMLDTSVPEDYFRWTRHIKETLMALFLHEEIFLKLDFIDVSESMLEDMLMRINKIDDLKYLADNEKNRKLN